jgi:hypothetical protein
MMDPPKPKRKVSTLIAPIRNTLIIGDWANHLLVTFTHCAIDEF